MLRLGHEGISETGVLLSEAWDFIVCAEGRQDDRLKVHFKKVTLRQGRQQRLVGRGLGSTQRNRENNMNMYLSHIGSVTDLK